MRQMRSAFSVQLDSLTEESAICWACGRTLGNIAVFSPMILGSFPDKHGDNAILPCDFVTAGKSRHGAPRWWCLPRSAAELCCRSARDQSQRGCRSRNLVFDASGPRRIWPDGRELMLVLLMAPIFSKRNKSLKIRRVGSDVDPSLPPSAFAAFSGTYLTEGSCVASQPPPSASMSCTLSVSCCIRRETAVCWLLSKVVCAVITSR